jgi:hypothetical protein
MRSFSSYAPMPNLGGAFTSGFNAASSAAIARDRLAAEAAQASMQMQMQREKLAQDAVQANMELAAKQEALQSKALRDEQELNIQKQYRDNILGLQEKELGQKEQLMQLKLKEAAQQFTAQQSYQQEAQAMIEQGTDPNEAYSQSARKWGPQLNLPASAYADLAKNVPEDFGKATPIEGAEGWKKFRQSDNSYAYFRDNESGTSEEGLPPGYFREGGKVMRRFDPPEVRDATKKLERMQKLHEDESETVTRYMAELEDFDSGWMGRKKFSPFKQARIDKFVKREEEIANLERQIEEMRGARPSGQPQEPDDNEPQDEQEPQQSMKLDEGKVYRNKSTGEYFRFVRGKMVPVPPPSQ